MSNLPVSGHNATSDHLKTWILRVYIHCEGCKKKVFKILQSIDGVYKTVIDSQQHKATVTGSVDGETLVRKLLKSGKYAEILPESFATTAAAAADNASGNPKKKKKKQSNKQNDGETKGEDTEHIHDEKQEHEDVTTGGHDDGTNTEIDGKDNGDKDNGSGGGKKKKNKKKKGDKNENKAPPNGETDGLPTVNPPAATGVTPEKVTESMEQLNLVPPINQTVYATPYDLPPYHNYYPTPAYGVSYSTSYPNTESSYYTPPVYGYAQSHPSGYYPPAPPPAYYSRSAFDDHDDEGDRRLCTIM